MGSMIDRQFEAMGARVKVQVLLAPRPNRRHRNRWRRLAEPIKIDIQRDDHGEYFDLKHRQDTKVHVLDVQPNDAHLVVEAVHSTLERSRFLCGHDERAWFVAAVPESAGVDTVQDAKDALKPEAVWQAIREHGVPLDQRDRRKTAAFVRQGEWFFIPRPMLEVNWKDVLWNEPIQRGGGKPHLCQYLYRFNGTQVYVSGEYPNGLTAAEFRALPAEVRERQRWEIRVRDAAVFVLGEVRHPDHDTICLPTWHQVEMNTETQARAMRHVVFLD